MVDYTVGFYSLHPSLMRDRLVNIREGLFHEIAWNTYVENEDNHNKSTFQIDEYGFKLLKLTHENGLDFLLEDENDSKILANILINLLRNIANADVQKYALVMIEEMLSENLYIRAIYFQNNKSGIDCVPFMRVLESTSEQESFCVHSASKILASLLSVSPKHNEYDGFINWLCGHITTSSSSDSYYEIATSALMLLLGNRNARREFINHGGIGNLIQLLRKNELSENSQLVYEVCFCLWSLTFTDADNYIFVRQSFLSSGAISIMTEQVSTSPREKVLRVAIAALYNLVKDFGEENPLGVREVEVHDVDQAITTEMLACGLVKVLKQIKGRNIKDEDLSKDVEALYNKLMKGYHQLSTYERYVSELTSGALHWGLLHTERFWRENAKRLEEDDFHILKLLITLLESDDDEIVSIACYDIGDFTRFYPNGRSIIKLLGAKDRIMHLIEHEDPEIQKHALQCISKIMIQNWEFLK